MRPAQPTLRTGPTTSQLLHPGRIRILKDGSDPDSSGPVVYWMFRDQRLRDNWALIHAVDEANRANVPVAVAFNLFDQFKGAKARQLGFMLRGLKQLETAIHSLGIPFFLLRVNKFIAIWTIGFIGSVLNASMECILSYILEFCFQDYIARLVCWESEIAEGEVVETIPKFMADCGASLLVTDFSPLREIRKYKVEIGKRVSESVSMHEIDAHNVVPTWEASQKLEYGARTIRSKINKLLPEYLIEFPELPAPKRTWPSSVPSIDWDKVIEDVLREGAEVPEVEWCEPGETAAREVLMGSSNGFLTKRLKSYSIDRNDPAKPRALSGISPYLHFGQISAQRCALEARNVRKLCPQAVDVFLEELIVRRELADNFCYYQPHYDSLHGAWEWARKTLMDHASDKREHVYTQEQLEKAQTSDPLWNASQLEMVHNGKMHGFLRMYWAKKILEWTGGPEEALAVAIYLNDKYEMDGRDPNGYVGCMWSICGVHDQGWKERPVFGKIRYMNYAGCKRKFDVDAYITYVKRIVGQTKKRKAVSELVKEIKSA